MNSVCWQKHSLALSLALHLPLILFLFFSLQEKPGFRHPKPNWLSWHEGTLATPAAAPTRKQKPRVEEDVPTTRIAGSVDTGTNHDAPSSQASPDAGAEADPSPYLRRVIAKITAQLETARARGESAQLLLSFRIDHRGEVQDIEIAGTQASPELGASVRRAVLRSSPFAPPPRELRVRVPVEFSFD